ncbi:MAG: FAD-dependent oxidoreductase [Prolixibacteraceae bacterium]|jgi:heterodisulfide reductase subunit A|nr:FAD-dependent oxidoreductase [Prolixibacteraceae bacterium]
MNKTIVIVGGGPAGLEAAAALGSSPHHVLILEKEHETGGKLKNWHHLFPNFADAFEILKSLEKTLPLNNPEVKYDSNVCKIEQMDGKLLVLLNKGEKINADAVLLATGFDLFDAHKKEEYGYGIYKNVVTSFELEEMFKIGSFPDHLKDGMPKKIAMVHCVGSRDKKAGNLHCSKLCCITGVKQAIELRKHLPNSSVYNFYMDLRMYGQHFEELYQEAQEDYGITFIRGRVSEIAENSEGSLQVKAEDTLSGRPMKMVFDMVVLLLGMTPASSTTPISVSLGLPRTNAGFLSPLHQHIAANETCIPGLFLAGTCREPLSLQESITDARAAAFKIIEWLKLKDNN